MIENRILELLILAMPAVAVAGLVLVFRGLSRLGKRSKP